MGYDIKGYSFGFMTHRGDLKKPCTKESLQALRETGTEWIALCVDQRQETKNSQEIRLNYNLNVTDIELIEFIDYAHELGMKVCLKPMMECNDRTWRAEIDFWKDRGSWAKWFYEYGGYITRMAELAEYTGCDMFCLGCEMLGTERQEKHWRELIAEVRELYHGPLTYNTNHGKEMVAQWYDAIDYIGTSAYYPVAKEGGASVEEMKVVWEQVRDNLKAVNEKWNKPIIFMEIGCRSARGCATMPWDFMHYELPYDEDEQANFFESCLQVFEDVDWMKGFFWWDWRHELPKDKHPGFSIYDKKASEVLKKYYTK